MGVYAYGEIRSLNPVKFFTGVLVADEGLVGQIEERLVGDFGPIDHRSELLRSNLPTTYSSEMGDILDRIFFSFESSSTPMPWPHGNSRPTGSKRSTGRASSEVTRLVNVDPGYIEQAKVILASTKNFYHRVIWDKASSPK